MGDTYLEYQSKTVSEKIGLVILQASMRLVGWNLHSGSIYKLENFNHPVIVSLGDRETLYTEVTGVGALAPGTYFNDRNEKILYVETALLDDPNSLFLVSRVEFYFSNVPVHLPHDLSTGFEVEWIPMLKNTSQFGVEIENSPDQIGIAIEGEGSLAFYNDKGFWRNIFNQFTFENNPVSIYSYNRELTLSEAKVIFKGTIQEKTYTQDTVSFKLKDLFNQLRQNLSLNIIGTVPGVKAPLNAYQALKRQIYGEVQGFRPQNIDQIEDTGYPLPGTVFQTGSLDTLTGIGTSFLTHLRSNDSIVIPSLDLEFTVQEVLSDTSVLLSQIMSQAQANSLTGQSYRVKPSLPKGYTNRVWQVSDHEIRNPVAVVAGVAAPNLFDVDTTLDFEVDDLVCIRSSEIVQKVANVYPTQLRLKDSGLGSVPFDIVAGDEIVRIAITDVKINQTPLRYIRDYTYDEVNGQLTLTDMAEKNVAQVKTLSGGVVTFPSLDTLVTGVGTQFTTELTNESYIWDSGTDITAPEFVKVLNIISDTELVLQNPTSHAFIVTQSNPPYKKTLTFQEGVDVLTCTTLGATMTGSSDGELIKTASEVIFDLLTKAGLASHVNMASFTLARALSEEKVGIAIPDGYASRVTPIIRNTIDDISRSVFGILIQNNDFEFEFQILRPSRYLGAVSFDQTDILDFDVTSDSQKVVKTVSVNYNELEYDPETEQTESAVETAISEKAQYLSQSEKSFEMDTKLIKQTDAEVFASRLSYFLANSRTTIEFKTKLRASRLKVTDKIDVKHPFLFNNPNTIEGRFIGEVTSVKKDVLGTTVTIDDLNQALANVAVIADDSILDYSLATDTDKLFSGFITDEFGMINNDQNTFAQNVIW